MTNAPSGYKRVRDDDPSLTENRKKTRDDLKDWRDVHLHSPRHGRDPRRDRDRDRTRSKHDSDHYKDRRDGSRRRERSRSPRSRSRRRERSRSRERRRNRSARPSHASRHASPRRNGNGAVALPYDDEKEEGEISPHPIPPRSPTPRQNHSRNARLTTPPAPKPVEPPKPQEDLPDMELDLPESPPPVEETLAARRARRAAILAKYAQNQENADSSAVQPPSSVPLSNQASTAASIDGMSQPVSRQESVLESKRPSLSPEPSQDHDFEVAKGEAEETSHREAQQEHSTAGGPDQINAADYDPSLDRREDEYKRVKGDAMDVDGVEDVEEAEEDDMDDMFAIGLSDKPKKTVKKIKKPHAPALITTATHDSAADPEGYYTVILGEQIDGGTYQVFSSLGKGMFANVVRARVLVGDEKGKEVAIKIVRCQESMYKAGLKEVQMLNKLNQADPDDKKHIVRLDRTFEHRGHLCLVFESLSMNLRDVVKRFGKDVGLNIRAVRAYAQQLFLALSLLRRLNVMHADIKPDNILVNEQKTHLKLCDLGSASDASENDITPYLVSRFYRAPEIILGVPYDPSLDIWSIGCTLYELYTGKILFPGRSNNQMLLLMMELKGRFNAKLLKKAKFGDMYFDEMGVFQSVEKEKVMGTDVIRKVHVSKPTRDLKARLMPQASKTTEEETKMLVNFIDLLDKCLALDPARRITPREALMHPFIRG